MPVQLPYPLPEIVRAAELSLALPDEIEPRLRALEQAAREALQRRHEQWRENDRAAQTSWAKYSGMLGSVGARADPYRPSPMPAEDSRLQPFLRFASGLAGIRSRMKKLRFHMLEPPKPAQAAPLPPEVQKLLGERIDNARALEIAKQAAQSLRALSVPADWPEPARWRRELATEALDATELAARCAAAIERQREAAGLFAQAVADAAGIADFERARNNRMNQARATMLAGDPSGTLLEELESDLLLLKERGASVITGLWAKTPPLVTVNGLLVRAEINESLGDSDEARRLVGEAAEILEPTLGRVVCPTREQFTAAMMEAMLLQMQGKPYAPVLARLRELNEVRAMALAYCNVGASAFRDTDPARADRYRLTAIMIARM